MPITVWSWLKNKVMKYKSKFIKDNLKIIADKGWYHQRFDGCLFFLDLISELELLREGRKKDFEFNSHLVLFSPGVSDWFIEQDDINRISELVFRKSFNLQKITDKKIISKLSDMEKKKELVKINFLGLKNAAWYHQQGDGVPFTMELVAEPYIDKDIRRDELNYKHLCLTFKDEMGHWYHDVSDLDSITKKITDRAESENSISKVFMSKWEADEKIFFEKSKRLDNEDMSSWSDEVLKKEFIDYCDTYLKAMSSSPIIDGFALGSDELIQAEIANFLKSKGLEKMQYKYFTLLTSPVTQSFINEGEISLLELADLINNNQEFSKILLESVDKVMSELINFPEIAGKLKRHAQDYFWIKNNYNDSYLLNEKDFLEEVKAMIEGVDGGINFIEEIERVKSTPIKSKVEKEKVIAEIDLPKYLRNLITISEDFTYWQDDRKKRTFWMTHYGFRFLEEIAKRTKYDLEELKFMVYPEIVSVLSEEPLVSKEEARERIKGCLFYHKGDEYEIVYGKEVEEYKKAIFEKDNNENVNDFRGMPASRGRVRGKVKVLMSVKEMDKVEKGDILVAVMTRPDYIQAIKKASAIVTNEGGVTCHAAIVSRELGIPCVIGTKIATKVLKDGDEVEVNANHGVVNIIKKS